MAARKRRTSKRRSVKLEELELQLAEAVETLEAIRSGAVDALVVQGQHGEQVFTLKGADQVYRVLVEDMNEGAVSVSREGCILYCNTRFAELVSMPLEKVVGIGVLSFVALRERANVTTFLRQSLERRGTCETILVSGPGTNGQTREVTVLLSSNPFPGETDIGCSMVITDITERKRMEMAQRELAKNILAAQEQERHRVSRELHDGISQLLSSARHRLHDVEKEASRLGRRKLSKDVTETRDLLERTMREVRLISRNLRPSELDDLGLSPALQGLVEDYQLRTKIRVDCKCYLNREPLEKDAELAIYRIIQEALTNISKHAEASEVAIRLTQQQGQLLLCIRDNGRGFDVSKQDGAGLGLANMRERASFMRGSLSVHSMPWQGTEIRLEIPSC